MYRGCVRPRELRRYVPSLIFVQTISEQNHLSLLLSQERCVIYFYVDWSAYAIRGQHMLEELESSWHPADKSAFFWLADVSDTGAPSAFIHNWLRQLEQTGLKIIVSIASGNGCVGWFRLGEIVDFERSVTQHNVESLAERTKRAFSGGATIVGPEPRES